VQDKKHENHHRLNKLELRFTGVLGESSHMGRAEIPAKETPRPAHNLLQGKISLPLACRYQSLSTVLLPVKTSLAQFILGSHSTGRRSIMNRKSLSAAQIRESALRESLIRAK